MQRQVHVIGVGMTTLDTPNEVDSYPAMVPAAGQRATDAGLNEEALESTTAVVPEGAIADHDNTFSGKHIVNPPGGLMSGGRPLEATALALDARLTRRSGGIAGACRIDREDAARQHEIGPGGCCVATRHERVA